MAVHTVTRQLGISILRTERSSRREKAIRRGMPRATEGDQSFLGDRGRGKGVKMDIFNFRYRIICIFY